MDNPINSELNKALWGDFAEKVSFPTTRPLLAHYTSVEVLEKIIATNEMWFSNPLYMNDWEELQFGMNAGASDFRSHQAIVEACGSSERHANLVVAFDRLFQNFDANHAIDTYVLCFSEHSAQDNDGLLSMWRGYGARGSGVALVFDAAKLGAIESSPLVLGKVYYGTQPERLDWIDSKIVAIAKVLTAHPRTDENLYFVAHAWIERLKMFSLFTKHSGFAEEREWRVVYFSERDQSRALASMLGYAITPKGVEPKLKLKIASMPGVVGDSISIDTLADRVILGPSISTVLAANSVRRMLEIARRPTLAAKVVGSSIPFRP
jgi:hypothetical protein